MQRTRRTAKSWFATEAAAWLACGAACALPTPCVAEPGRAAVGQAPAAVANPYVATTGAFHRPPANALGLKTTSWIAATNAVDETETTTTFRVPGTSSFVPTPVQTLSDDNVPPAPAVTLAAPPIAEVVIAPPPLPEVQLVEIAYAPPLAPRRESLAKVQHDAIEETHGYAELMAASSPWPAMELHMTSAPVGGVSDAAGETRTQIPVPPRRTTLCPQTATRPPLTTELTPQLLPAVQRGYALAQRGAMYAARAEFVQVLGRIAQAKDAAANSDVHAQALAAGLRAIDEAEDFVPQGVRVEAELDVRIVASSHRTPVLCTSSASVSPHEAVVLYHEYAREQLAAAVTGEQAGSMALHGLGKVSVTLAERGNNDPALVRSALTMYSAALAVCPNNPLAANELGVLLVRAGRSEEAARLFERTIDFAPSATAYHNLAIAQAKLGYAGQAAANEQESQRLAAQERAAGAVSRRAGVQWVSPEEMSGVAQPGLTPTAQVNAPKPKSPWQRMFGVAKRPTATGATTR